MLKMTHTATHGGTVSKFTAQLSPAAAAVLSESNSAPPQSTLQASIVAPGDGDLAEEFIAPFLRRRKRNRAGRGSCDYCGRSLRHGNWMFTKGSDRT
jgi:hypothetical protein